MKHFFTLIIILIQINVFSQNITVDDTYTAQNLVENVLFNNSGCATISNFNVSGNNSYAYFNGNGSAFPFAEGIVLSTGNANNTVGPNTSLSSDNLGTPIDADLAILFSDTLDTTVLEFDFVPVTNYMSFEYIFASEEYQEFNDNTCHYSDVFAFLIKKVGDPSYTNIAVIPNTTTPVQVTTVHGYVSDNCTAQNEEYFGSWNSMTDLNVPINFNGQTAVLTAESVVVPSETYHIKLVIADHTNFEYDSAVFLKAGSFNIGTDLGVDILRSTENALCGTSTTVLDSGIPGAISYTWTRDLPPYDDIYTALAGGNTQTYTVSSEGRYKVEIDLGSGCVSEGIITVEYGAFPVLVDSDLVSCNDDGSDFSTFDLSNAYDDITAGNNTLIVENYYHTFIEADANSGGEITNFDNYSNTAQDEEVFARVKNTDGCVSIVKITLKVFKNPTILADETTYYCLNTYPDTITFEAGVLYDDPADFEYKWFFNNGVDPIEELSSVVSTVDDNRVGDYIVEIKNTDGCVVTRTITVKASNVAIITKVLISDTIYAPRVSAIIEVSGIGDYEYAIDDLNFQDSNAFDNLLYGHHVITVRDKNGCIPNTQIEITILEYSKFFTPNNDGYYDTWNLSNIHSLLQHFNAVSDITIFDRYGKILAVIDSNGLGWDGTYNGVLLPSADYWFVVDLIDYKGIVTTKKGHFSLN